MDAPELQTLSALVGAPVVAAERSPWGFKHRTDLVTLADGRRLVVQRLAQPGGAAERLARAALLPDRLERVGVRLPLQIAADPDAVPPYAVREYLPGVPAATLLDTDAGAATVGRLMGALLPRLAQVETGGVPLDAVWADPQALAGRAEGWLAGSGALLDEAERGALAVTIRGLPLLLAGRAPRFAHGDFCPVNALVQASSEGSAAEDHQDAQRSVVDGRWSVVGLLDVEDARLADPLFDAAWWSWVVRFHHPARWQSGWRALCAAAAIPDDGATAARVRALQQLRCLELCAEAAGLDPQMARGWAGRLRATLGWAS